MVVPKTTEAYKEAFLKVYANKSLHLMRACEAADVGRSTVWKWRQTDPEFAQAVLDVEEGLIDDIEDALITLCKEGDVKAIIFFLRAKAKHRGYIEKPSEDPAMEQEIDKELLIKQTKQFLLESGEKVD